MIAITGASGKTGRALVTALLAREACVRAIVGRPEQMESMQSLGAHEVAVGNLEDLPSLEHSLPGIEVLYHICPNVSPHEEAIGRRVIEACRRSGVRRLVYHSVLHPHIEAMPHHWRKLRVEEQILESGLSFTILEPAAYVQNLRQQWTAVMAQGRFEVPFAADTRIGMVDLRDVAEVAARILCEPGHEGATYELCGSELLDQNEVAAVFEKVLARPVRVAVLRRQTWAERARHAGIETQAIESLLAMFRYYERHTFAGNPRVLASLLGRSPTRFDAVVRRWRNQAGGAELFPDS